MTVRMTRTNWLFPFFRKRVVVIKKIFAVIISALIVLTVFTACSGNGDDNTNQNTTAAIPTEEAKVKESDAVNFIKTSYTAEELGLGDEKRDYTFLVASNGVEIDGDKYVKVVANVIVKKDVTSENGKDTFTMETLGEYYISFDGKKVLMKDMKTNDFSSLENRFEEYQEKSKTTVKNAE